MRTLAPIVSSFLIWLPLASQADPLEPANDTLDQIMGCGELLLERGPLVPVKVESRANRSDSADFPRFELSARGDLLRIDRNDGAYAVTLFSRDQGVPIRSNSFATSAHDLRHLFVKAVSPDGKYLVVTGNEEHTKVISTQTGEVLLQYKYRHDGVWDDPRSFRFTDDGSYLTVNRLGAIQIYALRANRAVLFKEITVANVRTVATVLSKFTASSDDLVAAHYLPVEQALAAFYNGPEPLKIKLGPGSTHSINLLPSTADLKPQSPEYSYVDGLVSTASNLWIVPSRDHQNAESIISVLTLDQSKLLKRFKLPDSIDLMTLSPDGRLLAVAMLLNDHVLIYDLWSDSPNPWAELRAGVEEIARLTFISKTTLGLASWDGLPKSIELPAPGSERPATP